MALQDLVVTHRSTRTGRSAVANRDVRDVGLEGGIAGGVQAGSPGGAIVDPDTPSGGQWPIVLVLALAYYLALYGVHRTVVVPAFEYTGYGLAAGHEPALAASAAVFALVCLFVPRRLVRPSTLTLWILVMLVLAPVTIVASTISGLGLESLQRLGLVFGAFCLLIAITRQFGTINLRSVIPRIEPRVATVTFVGLYVLILGTVVVTFGPGLEIPSWTEFYDVRFESRTILAATPLTGYTIAWLTRALNPLVIAWGLIRRRWVVAGVGVLVQLFAFTFTAKKSVLFSVVLLAVVFVLTMPRIRARIGAWFLALGTLGVVGTAVVTAAIGNIYPVSLLVRRLILTAGMNTWHYFEFFSANVHYELRHSVLSVLGPTPFAEGPGGLIGRVVHQDPNLSANANFLADGMSNFGFWGVALLTIILGGLLVAVDAVSHGVDIRLSAMLIAIASLALANTAVLTTALTHGLLLVIVLLSQVPPSGGPIDRAAPEANSRRPRHRQPTVMAPS